MLAPTVLLKTFTHLHLFVLSSHIISLPNIKQFTFYIKKIYTEILFLKQRIILFLSIMHIFYRRASKCGKYYNVYVRRKTDSLEITY